MLLHLPRMASHGQPRVKNGPALAGHGAKAVRDAIASTITTLPEQLHRSLTWDQGAEMAQHVKLRVDTRLSIYFCDPHSPWQRGTNENTNGLLRQYFPKGTDLSRYSPTTLIRWPLLSIAALGRLSAGRRLPKISTIIYARSNKLALRRALESKTYASEDYRFALERRGIECNISQSGTPSALGLSEQAALGLGPFVEARRSRAGRRCLRKAAMTVVETPVRLIHTES